MSKKYRLEYDYHLSDWRSSSKKLRATNLQDAIVEAQAKWKEIRSGTHPTHSPRIVEITTIQFGTDWS